MSGFGGGTKAVEAGRGDVVAQTTATLKGRALRARGFTAASAEDLAAAIEAWCVAKEDVDAAGLTYSLNPEREIVDIQYQADGGSHSALLLWMI